MIKPQTQPTSPGGPASPGWPPRAVLSCLPWGSLLLRLGDRQPAVLPPASLLLEERGLVKLPSSSKGLVPRPVTGVEGGGISRSRKILREEITSGPSWPRSPIRRRCLGWRGWGLHFPLHFLPLFLPHFREFSMGGGLADLVPEREATEARPCSCSSLQGSLPAARLPHQV